MNMNKWILQAVICALLAGIALPAQAAPIVFWFGGEDPVTVNDKQRNAPADFLELFKPNSPWQKSASQVKVFKISMQFASRSRDADLAALIGGLQRRGIALAIEMGMLRNDRGCGKGEGYMPQEMLELAMKRIQHFGGRLDYVAMDEVVFFGREKNWPDQPGQISCRDSVEELVHEVAAKVAVIHRYFPQAKIGAVEPITTDHHLDVGPMVQDYLRFADLYYSETGIKLAFMHADIAWRSKNWQSGIGPLKAGMAARGIRFGIIIGGNPDFTDDVSWTNAGLQQLRRLKANPATAPEDVIIQSWQPLPTRYLPETAQGTSTWMLLQAETLMQ